MTMDRNRIKFIGITISFALIILFLNDISVQADIYRYVDENGVMHFTNVPTSSIPKFKVFLRCPHLKNLPYLIKNRLRIDRLILDLELPGLNF